MADAFQMMQAGAIASGAAQSFGAYSTYATGRADARNLRQAASVVDAQTAADEQIFRRQTQQALARQQAAGGQVGLRSGGSLDDVYRQSAIDAEMDALNLRYQGRLQAANLRNQAKATKRATTASAILQGVGAAANTLGGLAEARTLRARIQ